jgi:hypothetical protein
VGQGALALYLLICYAPLAAISLPTTSLFPFFPSLFPTAPATCLLLPPQSWPHCWKEWFNKSTHHLSVQLNQPPVQLPRLSHHHDIANRIPTFHPPPLHRLRPLQNDSLSRLPPHHRPLQTPHRHKGRRLLIPHRNRRPEPVSVQLHGTHRNPIPFQPDRSLTRYV